MEAYLERARGDWSVVETLIKAGELVRLNYRGRKFFLRKLKDSLSLRDTGT